MTDAGGTGVPPLEDTLYALLVTNMRIYDAIMALVTEANPELARNVQEMHAAGHMIGSSINYDGLHIYNEQNKDEE